MSTPPPLRRTLVPRGIRGVLLATGLLLGACPSDPVGGIDHVVTRLDAVSFPDVPTPRHGPVAVVGDEARSVVLTPEEVVAAESFGVAPSGSTARANIVLAPRTATLPDSAFLLQVQELPLTQRIDEKTMALVARENFSLRRDHGWRLLREDSTTVLELDHAGSAAVQFNLRLVAQLPVPRALESHPFDLPPGARLQLGFGLSNSREGIAAEATDFSATLTCAGREPRSLVQRRVAMEASGKTSWQDVESDVQGPARNCRLRLENVPAEDGPPRGAVWSVPKVLAPGPAGADDLNLVLVSLDTLRSSHLSGLGYGRKTSPTLDAEFLGRGTAFTDVSSTFPQTDVSHLSIFTGLYPSAQPKRGRVSSRDRLVLLAELLQQAGLETAAFTENALVSGAFGFWFGFDRFTERSFAHADRGRPTIEDGIRYIDAHRDRRFFLFLHTYKTHDPYVPGADYASLWGEADAWADGGPAPRVPERHRTILDRYDRTIREADDLVRKLLDGIAAAGIEERTIVIVTSDHGEAFGEHGITGHGFTPHQEALDVPLLLRGPGIPAGLKIDTPVSIADLTPTILELLGLAPTAQAQGISLAPALRAETLDSARPLFFSWLRPGAAGMRQRGIKFHRTEAGRERFDLTTDPDERSPDRRPHPAEEEVLDAHEEESARRRARLGPAPGEDPAPEPGIDERLEKSLEALGYL